MASRLLAVFVALTLLLAGCAGAGNNVADSAGGGDGFQSSASGGDGGSADLSAGAESSSQQSADGSQQSVEAEQLSQQRAIIRTGRVVVEVDNFSTSRQAIASRARDLGGYVSDSNQQLHRTGDATWRTGYIVVRVPSENYETMQEASGQQGTVISEETQTKDVTDQLVDLDARIENLKNQRDRLRTFYSRANDTEDLLRIEEQLSEVQGEIERLEAQRRSLEQRVAFSTLRVELREPSPGANEIRTQYHEQSLVAVFLRSVNDVYVFSRATLVTISGVLPWLPVVAIPALGIRRVLRGRRLPSIRSRDGDDTTDAESSSDEEQTAEPDEEGDSAAESSDSDGTESDPESPNDETTDDGR